MNSIRSVSGWHHRTVKRIVQVEALPVTTPTSGDVISGVVHGSKVGKQAWSGPIGDETLSARPLGQLR